MELPRYIRLDPVSTVWLKFMELLGVRDDTVRVWWQGEMEMAYVQFKETQDSMEQEGATEQFHGWRS